MRFMLDTNVFDRIITVPGLIERLNQLTAAKRLHLFTTPVQEEELAAMPDAGRRKQAQSVRRTVVPALDPGTVAASPRHLRDDLSAATAEAGLNVLVTEDGRLVNRLQTTKLSCEIWRFDRFQTALNDL